MNLDDFRLAQMHSRTGSKKRTKIKSEDSLSIDASLVSMKKSKLVPVLGAESRTSVKQSKQKEAVQLLASSSLSSWSSRKYLKLIRAPVLQHSLAVNYSLNKTKTLLTRCIRLDNELDNEKWAKKVTITLEELNSGYEAVDRLARKPSLVTARIASPKAKGKLTPVETETEVYKQLDVVGMHLTALEAVVEMDEKFTIAKAKVDSLAARAKFTAETIDSAAMHRVRRYTGDVKKVKEERQGHDVKISDYIRTRTSDDRCNLTDCLDIIQNKADSHFTSLMTERQQLSAKEKSALEKLEDAENALKFTEESKKLLNTVAVCVADASTSSAKSSITHKKAVLESSIAALEKLIPAFGKTLLAFVRLLDERQKYALSKLAEKRQAKERLERLYEENEASLELEELQSRINEYLDLIKSSGVKVGKLATALEKIFGSLLSGTSRLETLEDYLFQEPGKARKHQIQAKVVSPLRNEFASGTFAAMNALCLNPFDSIVLVLRSIEHDKDNKLYLIFQNYLRREMCKGETLLNRRNSLLLSLQIIADTKRKASMRQSPTSMWRSKRSKHNIHGKRR